MAGACGSCDRHPLTSTEDSYATTARDRFGRFVADALQAVGAVNAYLDPGPSLQTAHTSSAAAALTVLESHVRENRPLAVSVIEDMSRQHAEFAAREAPPLFSDYHILLVSWMEGYVNVIVAYDQMGNDLVESALEQVRRDPHFGRSTWNAEGLEDLEQSWRTSLDEQVARWEAYSASVLVELSRSLRTIDEALANRTGARDVHHPLEGARLTYQPPLVPLVVSVGTDGAVSVTLVGEVVSPLGTFGVEVVHRRSKTMNNRMTGDERDRLHLVRPFTVGSPIPESETVEQDLGVGVARARPSVGRAQRGSRLPLIVPWRSVRWSKANIRTG